MTGRRNRPVLDRLMERVSVDAATGCWVWTSKLNPGGYSTFLNRNAHRLMYEIKVGPVPAGLDLDHLCRNRACLNPAHLEPVTRSENLRRGDMGRRRRSITHCPKGHAYEGANLYVARDGHRDCVACQRQRVRDWRARRVASTNQIERA